MQRMRVAVGCYFGASLSVFSGDIKPHNIIICLCLSLSLCFSLSLSALSVCLFLSLSLFFNTLSSPLIFFVCLFLDGFVSLSLCLFVCLSVSISVSISVSLSVCLCLFLSLGLLLCLSLYIYPSVCLRNRYQNMSRVDMIFPLCKGENQDGVYFILCCPAFCLNSNSFH